MDTSQAKAILSAYRADMPDADDAAFSEALALAASDPELSRWFEDEQNFDEIFSGKLNSIEPPADLKAKLLALDPAAKTIPFPAPGQPSPEQPSSGGILPGQRPWWKRSSILSAAATVVIFLGFGLVLLDPNPVDAEPELDQIYDRIGEHFEQDPKPAQNSTDLDQIRGLLDASGLRSPGPLPPKVDALAEVGFGSFTFRDTTISFIEMKGDQTFCLYLLDPTLAGNHVPADGTPVVIQRNDLAMLVWRGSKNLCVLIVRGPVEEMKDLL
ncbi:hypothetical protein H5P28_07205 [Ruficoccus amylovorans]|uniref:DUF3379 family protein n=1 Tax=Ruficoccus amylovorans TaxID=1804625 RepID=A0A842HEP3_9BACT|nr:hypothetical protein [Ruficoccus amylovorans]MBC2594047.1 hypothetical protein [Ruficoccus amylovorans]